jgi:hypothetical protein
MAATTHIQWQHPVNSLGATPSACGDNGKPYVTDEELERAKRIVAGAGATARWALCMADIGLVDPHAAEALVRAKQIVRRAEQQRQAHVGRELGGGGWKLEKNPSWKSVRGTDDVEWATSCGACRFEQRKPAEIHRLRHTCGVSNKHLEWSNDLEE